MRPCLMYTIGDSCVVIVVVKTATAGAVFCLHSHCIMNGRLGLDVGCTTLNHASIILRAISSRVAWNDEPNAQTIFLANQYTEIYLQDMSNVDAVLFSSSIFQSSVGTS